MLLYAPRLRLLHMNRAAVEEDGSDSEWDTASASSASEKVSVLGLLCWNIVDVSRRFRLEVSG